jgi:small GTP-binding protein
VKEVRSTLDIVPPVVAKPITMTILMLGADGAGKSTFLEVIKGNVEPKTKPTTGFMNSNLKLDEQTSVKFYDVGGHIKRRKTQRNYFYDCHAVVYMIDCGATDEKWEDTVALMKETVSSSYLNGKPFLVLANKQDSSNARGVGAVNSLVNNELQLAKQRPVQVMGCVCSPVENGGKVDANLDKGLEWLIGRVREDYAALNQRVLDDYKSFQEQLAMEHFEKKKKLLGELIQDAFNPTIPDGLEGEKREKYIKDLNVMSEEEGLEFLSLEIGAENGLPKDAAAVARLVGFQRLALQIVGEWSAPVSKSKTAKTWAEIEGIVKDVRSKLDIS